VLKENINTIYRLDPLFKLCGEIGDALGHFKENDL